MLVHRQLQAQLRILWTIELYYTMSKNMETTVLGKPLDFLFIIRAGNLMKGRCFWLDGAKNMHLLESISKNKFPQYLEVGLPSHCNC